MSNQPIPPYERIARMLRDQIVGGVYSPGDTLPSTRSLVDQEGVAKATVDKAMRALKSDDLVESKPGLGLVVKDHQRINAPRDMFLRSTGLAQGIRLANEKSEYRHCGHQDLPDSVADAMGLPRQSKGVCRSRVIKRSGSPIQLATSWFPLEFGEAAPKLMHKRPIPEGTPTYVAGALGRKLGGGVDTLSAEPMELTNARALGVHPGEPVLYIASKVTDLDGGLIEYGVYHLRQGATVSYDYGLSFGQASNSEWREDMDFKLL